MDADFDQQLEEVLNLNHPFLRNNRKGVLDAILDWWRAHLRQLPRAQQKQRLEGERDRRIGSPGELQPYCQIAVWFIEQRLARIPT